MKLFITIDPADSAVISETELQRIAAPLLKARGLTGDWELECRIVDEPTMQALNTQAQGRNEPTDILSFPVHFATNEADPHTVLPKGTLQLLGSLVIAPSVLARQAAQKGMSEREELHAMLEHGLRHLLGDDHDDNAQWLPRENHRKFSPRSEAIHGMPEDPLV